MPWRWDRTPKRTSNATLLAPVRRMRTTWIRFSEVMRRRASSPPLTCGYSVIRISADVVSAAPLPVITGAGHLFGACGIPPPLVLGDAVGVQGPAGTPPDAVSTLHCVESPARAAGASAW